MDPVLPNGRIVISYVKSVNLNERSLNFYSLSFEADEISFDISRPPVFVTDRKTDSLMIGLYDAAPLGKALRSSVACCL
jgi:hypothetical protein